MYVPLNVKKILGVVFALKLITNIIDFQNFYMICIRSTPFCSFLIHDSIKVLYCSLIYETKKRVELFRFEKKINTSKFYVSHFSVQLDGIQHMV